MFTNVSLNMKLHLQTVSKHISYRSGFIEVSSNIHLHSINLELWQLLPDSIHKISHSSWVDSPELTDFDITSN